MLPYLGKIKKLIFFSVLFVGFTTMWSCSKEATGPEEPVPGDPDISFSFRDANGVLINEELVSYKRSNDSLYVDLPPGTYLKNLIPDISFHGKSIYPETGISQNFSSPVAYTVTSYDDAVTELVVKAGIMQKNNVVFVGNQNKSLLALDALSGQLIWKFEAGGSLAYSSPTYKDGVLYAGCIDEYVYALNPLNGELIWKFYAGPTGIESDAICVDSTVYVGSNDDHLYAIDAIRGVLRWKFRTGANISSSPVVSGDTIYFGSSDNNFYALSAGTGELIWQFTTGGMINQSAATLYNNTLYVGSRDGYLYAIDAATGSEKWKFSSGGISFEQSSPTVKDGVLYMASWYEIGDFSKGGSVYAINAETGALVWESMKGIGFSTSPYVYEGKLYIGGDDGNITALDIATGEILWERKIYHNSANPVAADGILYIGGSGTGYFYAFDALTGKDIWKYPTPGNYGNSSPLIVDQLYEPHHSTVSGLQP